MTVSAYSGALTRTGEELRHTKSANPSPTTTRPAPARWLLAHLIATGHLTETGLSRRARIRTCRCHAAVLAGLDAETCAFEVAADPTPLNPLGEALAIVEGQRTWSLHREGGRWVLDRRDAWHITAHPAGTRPREDVVREHRCTHPVADALAATSCFPETHPKPPANSIPPF